VRKDLAAWGSAPCGLWLSLNDADYIVIPPSVREEQYLQTLGHEIGHILLEHEPKAMSELVGATSLQKVFQDVPMDIVMGVLGGPGSLVGALGRTVFGDGVEEEAELFGAYVALKADRAALRGQEPPFLSSLRDSLGTRPF
jgi:hypothetical protein